MREIFADAFFYIALFNEHDAYHDLAIQWSHRIEQGGIRIWTTDAVLMEFANALSAPALRQIAAQAIRALQDSPQVIIVYCSAQLFDRAIAVYERHGDKTWSLTDCISFVVMQENNIIDALTGDRHFEQAGFRALLRRPMPT